MKRQINTLYVDLYRAFGSIEFLTAVFGVCIVYYIGAWSEIKFASDILYLFRYSSTSSTFYLLLVFVSVLPYTTCFCSDWNNEFIKPAMIRTGIREYCFSKVIACSLSSGCGIIMFLLTLKPWYTLVSPSAGNYQFYATKTLGGSFLLNGQYYKYFIVYILLGFFAGALWSTAGLLVSAFIPDKFVALCSPFIIYYMLNIATMSFPVWLRLNRITEGMCIIGGTFFSLCYAAILFITFISIIGLAFNWAVKRRLANG